VRVISLLAAEAVRSEGVRRVFQECEAVEAIRPACTVFAAFAQEAPLVDQYAVVEALFAKFQIMRDSPDAQCEVLDQIAELHLASNRDIEAATAFLLQAGLILDYLTFLKRIRNCFGRRYPCSVFVQFCPLVTVLPEYERHEDLPVMPTFCDSIYFSMRYLFSLIMRVLKIYESHDLYDLAAALMNILWPLFECYHWYGELATLMERYGALFGRAQTSDTADTFWRVSFPDGRSYVYRFLPLTKLQEFQNWLVKTYSQIYNAVEILGELDAIDPAKAEQNITFLRLGNVLPSTKGGKVVTTRFSQYFMFATPFVKGSNRAHAKSEGEQWLRRTIVKTAFALPNFFGRSEIVEILQKEYSPIQVACFNLRDQADRIAKLAAGKSLFQLQPVVIGSWSTQVNAGPAVYIGLFLEGAPETKETRKLKQAYADFVSASHAGLQAHAALADASWVQMQSIMESNFQAFKELLTPHIRSFS
jgi:hypothetical protein